jgi:CHAD domain-containing protein
MGYAFDQDDATLQVSLRRIAGDELEQAIDSFSRIDQPEAVHAIRKHLKKTRALLRLLRSGFPGQADENAALRVIGLALATRRDAAVRLTCFQRLFPEPPKALRPLHARLAADSQPAAALPPDLPDALRAIRKRVRHWSLDGKDKAILKQGLTETRKKAIRAAKAARAEPGSGALVHDWRKQVQQHWFQARLFTPAWPALFAPIVSAADELAEMLGDHHDLGLFAHHAGALPASVMPARARRLLEPAIMQERASIETAAFPLSARLFAGDPPAMAEAWIELRSIWRNGA